VHGFGGGYRLPVVPAIGREAPVPGLTLEAGMTLVVQPNVVTPRQDHPSKRPYLARMAGPLASADSRRSRVGVVL
jgi:hypothetical protein